jgi:hypothetical protein
MYRFLVIAAGVLALLAACSLPSGARNMGNDAATAASELQKTAVILAPTFQAGAGSLQETAKILAPTLEARAPGLRQTLEALAPTLQAQAPEVRATLIALATNQPVDGVAVRQTVDALTNESGSIADIPMPKQRQILNSTANKLTYTTSTGYGQVLEIYQSGMPNLGWELGNDSISNENASVLYFTKGSKKATITIARLAQGATVDVTIE